MTLLTRILYALVLATCAANAAPTRQATQTPRLIHQVPLGTWVENIAVRSNGNILVTFVNPTPSLHQIDPLSTAPHSNLSSTLVHTFANHTQLTGISELTPDVFAVVADSTIYRVAFANTTTPPTIAPLATIPAAGVLNGMAALPDRETLLISDSSLGLVWRLDARTGAHGVALRHETMQPGTDLDGVLLGVDGLRCRAPSGAVYYVNTPRRLFCRVAVDPATGAAAGAYEVVAEGALSDDFCFGGGEEGPVGYLAGLDDNVVTRVGVDGGMKVVAGAKGRMDVAGATSGAFAGGVGDGEWLVVCYDGGWEYGAG